jgi:hypothetical protein
VTLKLATLLKETKQEKYIKGIFERMWISISIFYQHFIKLAHSNNNNNKPIEPWKEEIF